jgi:hypothetical protein
MASTRAARPGTSLSHKHSSVVVSSLPLPHILTTSPFYASPRPRQWHHLSPGSYSTGRCSPTLDKARDDHSYVRRDPRGSCRLSHPSSPPIRVWGLSCTPPPTHRTLFYTLVSTHVLPRVSTSSPLSFQCEAFKNPLPTNFTSVLL